LVLGKAEIMGRSPNFPDILNAIEDYADKEGMEVFQVLNEITEHFVPGIEDIATEILIVEETELH
jgi:hypothetical protein